MRCAASSAARRGGVGLLTLAGLGLAAGLHVGLELRQILLGLPALQLSVSEFDIGGSLGCGIGLGLALRFFLEALLLGRSGIGLSPLSQHALEILDLEILDCNALGSDGNLWRRF